MLTIAIIQHATAWRMGRCRSAGAADPLTGASDLKGATRTRFCLFRASALLGGPRTKRPDASVGRHPIDRYPCTIRG